MGAASNGQIIRRMQADREAEHAVQEQGLAYAIGEAVALHLSGQLPQVVAECWFCLTRTAETIRAYQGAVANAQAAAEPVPDPPQPEVRRSVTSVPVVQMAQTPNGPFPVGCSVPSCFECMLNPPQPAGGVPVAVGLVDLGGRPISFRRG